MFTPTLDYYVKITGEMTSLSTYVARFNPIFRRAEASQRPSFLETHTA